MVNQKQMYVAAILGLGVLVWWLSKSSMAQSALINTAASPFNTSDPAKADKKLGVPTLSNMKKGGASKPKVSMGLTQDERRLQDANLASAAKFPAQVDFIKTSQHEEYTREKGALAANEQFDTYGDMSFDADGMGDRRTVKVPGEKQEVY